MQKIIIIFITLILYISISFGQATNNDKMFYIVDSIPVIEDPEEGNEILQTDVADIKIIKNKDSLKTMGFEQYDGVTYLFTNAYRNRSEIIKLIPSSKLMKKNNGAYLLNNNLYSGQFIDYYYCGNKQGEGTFLNGKLTGKRKVYYKNGKLKTENTFKNGLENGLNNTFYLDGTLKATGEWVNGKEEGIWKSFYANGQVALRSNYKNGEIYDTATKYYSTGKIKENVFIKDGKVIPDPSLIKINQLMTKGNESNKEGNIKAAIKYCSKALEIDSTYAEAYFSRGTIKLNDFKFDDAISDFDKALKFEPLMAFALANRAFARIRKYQFASSRTLSHNSEVTVLASKDKVPVPEAEQEMICNDLQKAVYLGNNSKMISEALSDYCKVNSSH